MQDSDRMSGHIRGEIFAVHNIGDKQGKKTSKPSNSSTCRSKTQKSNAPKKANDQDRMIFPV